MTPLNLNKRLIILDRDGVINFESMAYIKSPDEWVPLPHSLNAIARLHQAGFKIAVASNQSGIARGYFDQATLDAITNKMLFEVEKAGGKLDAVFYCRHKPDDECNCRKPKTGLLQNIAEQFQISLEGVPFIGDSWRDWQAALTVGARPLLVKTGFGEETIVKHHSELDKQFIFDDLWQATNWLLMNLSNQELQP